MAGAPVVISIIGDANSAVRAFRSTETAAKRAGDGLFSFGNIVKGIGFGLALEGLAKLGAAATEAFSGAVEAARNVRVLNSQIANLGPIASKAFAGANDFAEEWGAHIGKDDDDIRAVLAKLASFPDAFKKGSLGAQAMERATKAAFDLEAIGIGQAESNILQIGKALNDPIKGMTALTKSGVSFTAEQKKQIANAIAQGKLAEAQKILLQGIESNAKGAAEAAVSPIVKMRVAAANFAEGLATEALPAMQALATFVLDKGIPALQRMWDKQGPKVIAFLKTMGTTAKAAFDKMKGPIVDFVRHHGPQVIAVFKKIGDEAKLVFDKVKGPLGDFIKTIVDKIADFAKGDGQRKMGEMLAAFNKVDVGQLVKMVAQVAVLAGIFKVGTALGQHPILTLLGILAAKFPEQTAKIIEGVSDALSGVIEFAADNPKAVAAIAGLIAAYKGLEALKGVTLPNLAQKVGLAVDEAGAIAAGTTMGSKFKRGLIVGGGGIFKATTVALAVLVVFELLPTSWQEGLERFVKSWWKNVRQAIFNPGEQTEWDKAINHFFAITLPNFINFSPASKGEGGWSGLGNAIWSWLWPPGSGEKILGDLKGVGKWFAGLGKDIWDGIVSGFNMIANPIDTIVTAVAGWLWAGPESLLGKIKRALGISSPSTVFRSIGVDIVQGLIDGIVAGAAGIAGVVAIIPAKILAFFIGTGTWLVQAGKQLIGGFISGISSRVAEVGASIASIPGTVMAAFSGAGNWLLEAGRRVIGGLLDGLRARVGEVRGVLADITAMVPNEKGPPARDRRLLFNNGQLIMEGLIAGIQSQERALAAVLGAVSESVQGGLSTAVSVGRITVPAGTGRLVGAGSTVVHVNVPPVVDASEVGRQVVKAVRAYQSSIGRQFLAVP